MSGDESFDVEPEDVKQAGHNATEIGDRLLRDRGDLLDQAGGVSRGIAGFALTGALRGCAQAWQDELGSAGRETRSAGEELLRTAHSGRLDSGRRPRPLCAPQRQWTSGRRSRLTAFVTVVLALSTLSACAGGAVRDSRADDKSTQECPLPQAAGLPTPEKTVTKHYLKVTDIRSKTTGVIAREPKYIVAAVPNIYSDGTRTALSGTVDGESYRVQDLRDGQDFEISGVSFRIAIHPDHDKVTVCQLADTPVP